MIHHLGFRSAGDFLPGACLFPLRGDFSFASRTNSFSRSFGTAITRRITSLKRLNSGVASKAGSFITLPKRACACRAPASSCLSRAHLWLKLHFAGQFLVGDPASNDLFHDPTEPFGVRGLAAIKFKCLLIDIPEQVIGFDADVRAAQSAFKQAPEVFQTVGMDIAPNVGFGVVNELVRVISAKAEIGQELIAVNCASALDTILHVFDKIPAMMGAGEYFGSDFATALKHRLYGGLVRRSAVLTSHDALAPIPMHVTGIATYIRLIYLDFANKLGRVLILHRQPEPLQHEPSRLLGDAQPPMDFVGRNAVLAANDHPCRRKPLFERNRGILKDRTRFKCEGWHGMLRVALPSATLGQIGNVVGTAVRAFNNAIRPAQFHHELAAVLEVREPDNRVSKSVGSLGRFHVSSMHQIAWYVKYIITNNVVGQFEKTTPVGLAIGVPRSTSQSLCMVVLFEDKRSYGRRAIYSGTAVQENRMRQPMIGFEHLKFPFQAWFPVIRAWKTLDVQSLRPIESQQPFRMKF